MMKTKLLVFFLLFCCTSAFADEWQKGYVITNQNDTLNGYMLFRGTAGEWKDCHFRSTKNGAVTVYMPSELQKRVYDLGLCYQTMQVDNKYVQGDCFVRCLVEGMVSLNFLEIELTINSTFGMYIAENSILNKRVHFYPIGQGESLQRNEKRIHSSLMALFNDEPIMEQELANSSLTMNSLIKTVKHYNDLICKKDVCVVYTERKKKLLFFLAVEGGGMVHKGQESSFTSPFGSVAGSIAFSKFSKRLVANVSFSLSPLEVEMHDGTQLIEASRGYMLINISPRGTCKGFNLSNSITLEYRWDKGRIWPLAECGIYQNKSFVTEQNVTTNWRNKSWEYHVNNDYNFGFTAAIGVDIALGKKKKSYIPIKFTYSKPLDAGDKLVNLISENYKFSIGYAFSL